MRTLITLVGAALLLAACSNQTTAPADPGQVGQRVPVEGGSYIDITAQELKAMLESKDFPLINVHIPYEGEIEGTDAFIPFNQIADFADQLPQDKDVKIVIYCRSGGMSAIAARALVQMGYTNVYNLDGGFRTWQAAGYPFVNDGG